MIDETDRRLERRLARRRARRNSRPRIVVRDPAMLREAFALLYGIIGLSLVFFHGAPRSLAAEPRLFAWFGINFLVLFCVPAFVIVFVRREPLSRYGLRWGDVATWGRYFLVFFVAMVPLVLIVSRTPDFHQYYPRFAPARDHVGYFLLSAAGWLVYFFAWEWFFRGFMLFSLAPRLGAGVAILAQMIPFTMMHYTKLEAEAWAAIVCGIALGLMAFRGKSFIGTWLLHWSVATFMDLIVLVWPLR